MSTIPTIFEAWNAAGPDAINSIYEALGGVFVLLSVWKSWRQRSVEGVSWMMLVFFASWGWWNLYYYSWLDQTLSFYGSASVAAANSLWLVVYAYIKISGRVQAGPSQMDRELEALRRIKDEDRAAYGAPSG